MPVVPVVPTVPGVPLVTVPVPVVVPVPVPFVPVPVPVPMFPAPVPIVPVPFDTVLSDVEPLELVVEFGELVVGVGASSVPESLHEKVQNRPAIIRTVDVFISIPPFCF